MINQFISYFATNGDYVFGQFIRHFLISVYGVLFASIVAIPIGFLYREDIKWLI